MTAGGDSPGMNAAIRSVVRSALYNGLKVDGIIRGYDGLIDDDIISLDHRSVSGIISRGGTILKTARSERFIEKEGQEKAVATLKKRGIDALVVIGGDGTYRGANELFTKWKVPTVGLPGTIDNDLFGTDYTIGCQTAINTALDSIDKVRDTAHSMERIFVIEVMGNKSGYLALQVAIGAGAEEVIIPEKKFDYAAMCKNIVKGNKKGKVSWMIVVAEGAAKAANVAETITTMTGLETRYVVLGHVQRGGTPSGLDRVLATRFGAEVVNLLLKKQFGKAVGVLQNEIHITNFKEAVQSDFTHVEDCCNLIKTLV